MAATISAVAEPAYGRVAITAQGGVPGESFFVIRRDTQGSNLIREVTGNGIIWDPDPASEKTNLLTNPDSNTLASTIEIRRNHALNPDMKLPSSNVAGTWSIYTSGTVTGTQTNTGTGEQKTATSSINAAAKYGLTNNTAFTATTVRTVVKIDLFNGLVTPATVNTIPMKVMVEFRSTATVVDTQTVTMGDAAQMAEIVYAGGSSINNVQIWVYVENTTGSTVAVAQRFSIFRVLVEQAKGSDPFFSGASPSEEAGEVTYFWVSTANNSASVQRRPGVKGATANNVRAYSVLNGSERVVALMANAVSSDSFVHFGDSGAVRHGMVAGKTYTLSAEITLTAALTGSLSANSRRLMAYTKVGAAATVTTSGAQAPNVAGTTRVSVTFTLPAGVTEAWVRAYNGSSTYGETVTWDKFTLVEGTGTEYFSGNVLNGRWNGTPDDSTSTKPFAALPISVYDYEARQGVTTDFIVTDDVGRPGAYSTIDIPVWGTWLKDPFRPFMNCRVLWNSDGPYVRQARREKMWARGAKFPVFQSDRRQAPAGTIKVATETNADSRKLMSLLDTTDIVMVDVDPAFGVPVRYVSIGDLSGDRVGDKELSLTWEARYWTLPVDEVAMPIGAPITQGLSYDQLAASFGSYVAIPANVASYDDLAAGTWS